MTSNETIELGRFSNGSSLPEADSDVDEKPSTAFKNPSAVDKSADPQTSLRNELRNFAEGQADRIAMWVDSGANPKHLYKEGARQIHLTTLHILFDAFSNSDEDDETKQRSCVECKNSARSHIIHRTRAIKESPLSFSAPLPPRVEKLKPHFEYCPGAAFEITYRHHGM